MNRWTRGAAVNSKLIIALVVLVLVVGGYWVMSWRSKAAEKAKYQGDANTVYKLYCPQWDEPREYTKEEALKLKSEGKKIENPETGVCDCSWTKPRGDVISVP
ncbi:MAG: hypothetical protein PVJ57_16505 [Phycisphaerae bacterium]|jgi:hypothetical protein